MNVDGRRTLMTSVLHKCIMASSFLDVFLDMYNLNCLPASVQPKSHTIYFLLYGDDIGHINSKRNQVLLLLPKIRVT